MFLSVVWLDEMVIGVLLMAWRALVCCVLAQVRPLSDVWQGIELTAVLVPVALLLPRFFFFLNSAHPNCCGRNPANGLFPHSLVIVKHFVLVLLQWRQYTGRHQTKCMLNGNTFVTVA